MMGIHQPQKELFSYQVDLDRRVRTDHPLRRLNAVLDLSFVRAEVGGCYGSNGHVPVDPVVLVRRMILLFLEDIPSERELMARLGERLDYPWFLGFGLDTPVPNHSVLSKARKPSNGFSCVACASAWRRDWWTVASCMWTPVWWTRTPAKTRSWKGRWNWSRR